MASGGQSAKISGRSPNHKVGSEWKIVTKNFSIMSKDLEEEIRAFTFQDYFSFALIGQLCGVSRVILLVSYQSRSL